MIIASARPAFSSSAASFNAYSEEAQARVERIASAAQPERTGDHGRGQTRGARVERMGFGSLFGKASSRVLLKYATEYLTSEFGRCFGGQYDVADNDADPVPVDILGFLR